MFSVQGGMHPIVCFKGRGNAHRTLPAPNTQRCRRCFVKSKNRESASHRYAPFKSVVAWMTSGTPRGPRRHQRWWLAVHRSVNACRTLRPSHTTRDAVRCSQERSALGVRLLEGLLGLELVLLDEGLLRRLREGLRLLDELPVVLLRLLLGLGGRLDAGLRRLQGADGVLGEADGGLAVAPRRRTLEAGDVLGAGLGAHDLVRVHTHRGVVPVDLAPALSAGVGKRHGDRALGVLGTLGFGSHELALLVGGDLDGAELVGVALDEAEAAGSHDGFSWHDGVALLGAVARVRLVVGCRFALPAGSGREVMVRVGHRSTSVVGRYMIII